MTDRRTETSGAVLYDMTAAPGKEAIDAIRQQDSTGPYDIVFMDWRMPGMDGLQASRYIKSDETLRHQPAIVLATAFGREEVREEAERLQLDGFLVKPITKSMIVDTLVNVFADGGDGGAKVVDNQQPARLRSARILLAEDNDINMLLTRALLSKLGHRPVVVASGADAFENWSAAQAAGDAGATAASGARSACHASRVR